MKRLIFILLTLSITFCGCVNNKQLVNNYSNKQYNAYENNKKDIMSNNDNKEIECETVETVTETSTENKDMQGEKIEETQPVEITISFVGDCTIGTYKGQGTYGTYNEYYDKYGGEYFLENVRHIFESDDITFINLEGPITNKPTTVDKKFPISCRSEHINVINNSSIEVCSLSNNHTRDCGSEGLDDTISILDEHNIGYCGEGNVYRSNINGVDISCLAYNGWSASDELLALIKKDISFEKENGANIVCVMFHWGAEREHYSNSTQQTIAYHTIDAGADIVVGGHPHVIQGIEQYNGKTIVYSLGNFTFGANKNPSDKDTFIFQQTFVINGDSTKYGEYKIIPCSISSENNINNYQPTPLDLDDYNRVIQRLKDYSSKYENTIFE